MPLPVQTFPHYDLLLPSTKKKISFRPYTVREQSILLLAGETKDTTTIAKATKDVVSACITTPKFDVDTMTCFDLQYFFVNLRAKSVGEFIEMQYTCNNQVDAHPFKNPEATIKDSCKTLNVYSVDLREVKVFFPPDHKDEIIFDNKLGIKMGYPNLDSLNTLNEKVNNYTMILDLVVENAKYVFDENKIYDDFTKEEMKEFINNLGPLDMDKLIQFYSTIPYITYTINFKCKKCGAKQDIVLKGLDDFFE